jgi:hypothetical protein
VKKKNRKLRLNRETIRFLDSGLEQAAGGVTIYCTNVTACGSACPACPSVKCEGSGTSGNPFGCTPYTNDPCTGQCGTGGACTAGTITGCGC